MNVKVTVVDADDERVRQLFGKLFGREEAHQETCRCVDCTGARMAQEDEPGKAPSGEIATVVLEQHLLKVAERARNAEEAVAWTCAASIEKPVRPVFDEAILQMRVDEYNANVRCLRTLVEQLPEERKVGMPEIPTLMSWESALEKREALRTEITDAIAKAKITASLGGVGQEAADTFGKELAELMKDALKEGRPQGQIAAEMARMIRTAAERAKNSMREASAEASP